MSHEALNPKQFGDSHHWMHPTEKLHHWDDPARSMGDEAWDRDELTADVQKHGVKNPLEVMTHRQDPGKVFVVQGNHRLAAARDAGLSHVPVTDYPAHAGEYGWDEWEGVPPELRS